MVLKFTPLPPSAINPFVGFPFFITHLFKSVCTWCLHFLCSKHILNPIYLLFHLNHYICSFQGHDLYTARCTGQSPLFNLYLSSLFQIKGEVSSSSIYLAFSFFPQQGLLQSIFTQENNGTVNDWHRKD